MILYGVSFFIFLFCSFSLFFRSGFPLWIKFSGTALIFIASMKYVIYQIIGGAFFSPALPRLVIIVLETLYGALFLLFFLLILWDFYLACNWLLSKTGIPVPHHLPTRLIKTIFMSLALSGGIWGIWETLRVPNVHQIQLTLPDMPCELNDLSIVQLTDLHIGPLLGKKWLSEVVEKVNELNPDLILLTGDYVDGHVKNIGGELAPLGKLQSKYGIFAISGNHEYYWNVTEWEDAISSMDITWLNNEHAVVRIPNANPPVVIIGIPDRTAEKFGFPAPNLDKALKEAPEGLRILLSHQPKEARENIPQILLQLSGHTHGGTMFFLRPLIAKFNGGFVNGLYKIANGALYVSPGTGIWNGFSSRIGVPAEITYFILNCQNKNEEQD